MTTNLLDLEISSLLSTKCLTSSNSNYDSINDNNNLKKSYSCFELNKTHQNNINNNNNNNCKLQTQLTVIADNYDCDKKSIERLNILKEILSSEKKYLNDLREIVQV